MSAGTSTAALIWHTSAASLSSETRAKFIGLVLGAKNPTNIPMRFAINFRSRNPKAAVKFRLLLVRAQRKCCGRSLSVHKPETVVHIYHVPYPPPFPSLPVPHIKCTRSSRMVRAPNTLATIIAGWSAQPLIQPPCVRSSMCIGTLEPLTADLFSSDLFPGGLFCVDVCLCDL